MGLPAEKRHRATYADVKAVADTKVAEIVNGELHVFSRPAYPHARAASRLGGKLMGPFDLGEGGPGGWIILDEPELHFGPKGAEDILVPDIAGWRVERMPRPPRKPYFTVAPDWVCEVLSPSTAAFDRAEKLPVYAREAVRHGWFINPIERTLEIFEFGANGRWFVAGVHRGSARVRAEPFSEIELDLSLLWLDEEPEVDVQE